MSILPHRTIKSFLVFFLFSIALSGQCLKKQVYLEEGETDYFPYDEASENIDTTTLVMSEIVNFAYSQTAPKVFIDYPTETNALPMDLILQYGMDGLKIADFYVHANPNLVADYQDPCRPRIYHSIIYQVDENNLLQYQYLYTDYTYEEYPEDPFVARKKAKIEAITETIGSEIVMTEEEIAWNKLKEILKFSSKTAFIKAYNEQALVTIALTRPELPDFLKSTRGSVTTKRNWFYDNVESIDSY